MLACSFINSLKLQNVNWEGVKVLKFNRFAMAGILLIAILAFGAVSAAEDINIDNVTVVGNSEDSSISSSEPLNAGEYILCESPSNEILSSDNGPLDEIGIENQVSVADGNAISSSVPIDVKVINNSKIDISIPNATGKVVVIIDTNETSATLNDYGTVSIPLNNLPAGDHSAVVVYEGDGTHDAAHTSVKFNIPDKTIAPVASEFCEIVIGDDLSVTLVLKDEKGNVISNAQVLCTIDGVKTTQSTDSEGSLTVKGKNGAVIDVSYEGNDTIIGTYKTLKLNNEVAPIVKVESKFNIPGGVITINGYAVDNKAGEEGIYYSTQLLDAKGKPIKDAFIQFAVNNKIYNRTTDDDGGFAPYKLNMIRAGRYTMAFYFSGDENYASTFAAVCVDLDKKPITIKASSKSFKASATKKYTVTLSTIVGSSHDGKVHLSPKEVKLKVNGKTYTGKTNSKGEITFNLKITKKGKYAAKISYEGDVTYESAEKSVKITIK